jgi:hypothetical protein
MLNYNPSTVPIFQSEDYNQFTFIKGNRPLNQRKIERIISEINSGNDMLKYSPIQVKVTDDKLKIIDGQHRFFISKKLARPVHFIIVHEEKSIQDIARINSNVEKWKDIDFINCYITAGINDYQILKNFLNDYGFSVGVSLMLLNKGTPGNATGAIEDLNEKFQQGTFQVKCLDEAKNFADQVKLFSSFKNWRSRAFVLAIFRIIGAGKVSFTDVVAAFNKNQSLLKEHVHFKEYIINLEQIVNVGKHNRIIIT